MRMHTHRDGEDAGCKEPHHQPTEDHDWGGLGQCAAHVEELLRYKREEESLQLKQKEDGSPRRH